MSRALVVYESMFGNTGEIAAAVADALSWYVVTTLVEVGEAPRALPVDVDLLVVGGPTHAFGMSRAGTREDAGRRGAAAGRHDVHTGTGIREWLDALPPVHPPVSAATFDTKVRHPNLPGSAARAARRRLERKGASTAEPANTFWVQGTLGPLRDGELERAHAWGERLAQELTGMKELTS